MNAGTLELQLVADVARLRQDMDRMTGIVSRGAAQMERALEQVRGAMGGLFTGASAAGFVLWIKGAIDFADELNDLNKTTGISIEKLAGLSLMSKQSGSDLTGVAKSINKLALEMGKDAEKFARIGITAKDPLEAFKQLSDIFRQIENPQLRAAVAAEALGKGWEAAAPALAEGSARIAEMVERGEDLAGITQRDAELADAFNDAVSELGVAIMGTSSTIARDMLPLITALVQSLTDVTDEANKTDIGFNVMTETMRAIIVLGGNVAFVVNTMAKEIGVMAAQVVAFFSGDFKAAAQIGREWTADAEKRRTEFDAWEARMMTAGRVAKGAAADFRETERQFRAMNGALTGGPSAAALRGFADGGKADRAAAKAAEEAKRAREKELAEAAKAWAERMRIGRQMAIQAAEDAERERDAETKSIADQAAAYADMFDAREEAVKKAQDEAKAEKAAAAAIGLTTVEVAQLEAAKIRDHAATLDRRAAILQEIDPRIAQTYRDEAAALRERAEAQVANAQLREQAQQHADMWRSIDQTAHDVFVNIFEDGAGTFKRLGQTLKAALLDMLYQMTIKKWIVNISANVSGNGSAAGGTAQSMMGGGFNLNNMGLVGAGIQAFTGASVGASAASLGAANMVGALGGDALGTLIAANGAWAGVGVGAGAAGGAGAAAAGAVGAGGGMAAGAGLAAAIPVIGWVVAAAALLYSIFGKKGGGPKLDGTYGQLGSSLGLGRHTQESDAAAMASAMGIQATYNQLAQAYGGRADINYGLGFSMDPAGKSPSFLDISGSRNGQVLFSDLNLDAGRSQEELQAAITKMSSKAIIAGLQQSDLQGQIGKWLKELGNVDALSEGALSAAVARVQKAFGEKQALEDRLFELTHKESDILLRNRQREIDALDESNRALAVQIYNLEDQRVAMEQLAAAQVDMISQAQSLKDFMRELNMGSLAALSPEAAYQAAKAEFARISSLDLTSPERLASLPDAGRALLEASRGYNASSSGYFMDLSAVKGVVQASSGAVDVRVQLMQSQLAAQQETNRLQAETIKRLDAQLVQNSAGYQTLAAKLDEQTEVAEEANERARAFATTDAGPGSGE